MSPSIALLICIVGVAGLFYLDRDNSVHTSPALWLPCIWLAIAGSRPVSVWFGISLAPGTDAQLDGSPADRLIFQVLLVAAITVLIFRAERTRAFLTANWPILIYLFYCLVSVVWSDYQEVAAKRWIKAIGDLAMVLIVVTDASPAKAFKRLISRVGFVLLPASILLIKYYGYLGRGYDPSGDQMNTGVTTNKNSLGVITLVITLGVLWNVLELLRAKDRPNRGRHLLAQGVLLAFGVTLLVMAQSATSQACFILGGALMLVTRLPIVRRRPAAVHALVLTLFLVGGLTFFFGGGDDVVHALGRQSNLTGRTDIWAAVIPVVPNKIVGAGYETFWLGPRLNAVWHNLPRYMSVNEAHNGYIEMYLNLGWVGVGLIALILITGYGRVVGAFRRDPAVGGLWLAYLFAAAFYSITEAGFRLLNPIWIFLLLAIVAAGGVARGVGAIQPVGVTPKRSPWLPATSAGQIAPSSGSTATRDLAALRRS
ncbi:MAG: O-antigen ligase family protein [Candidatus Acidiferrales bacterium]|jgi:O-antigen ligase